MDQQLINEKRAFERLQKRIPVSIYYDGLLIAERSTCNISAGGMLIKTNDLGVPVNGLVEVWLNLKKDFGLNDVRLPAVVQWFSHQHLAVSFEMQENDIDALIRTLMKLPAVQDHLADDAFAKGPGTDNQG